MISLHIDGDTPDDFMKQLQAVAAVLLGSASVGAIAAAAPAPAKPPVSAPVEEAKPAAEAPAGETVAASDDTVDAAGWPWSPELHASTKGTTKEGLWRMKVGVSRPDPKPGFPKADGGTGTVNAGTASTAPATVASADAGQANAAVEDEDEFAAFRAAADKSAGTDAAAASGVPARKWTDADLGALCNQAAVKFGDPAPVKALITEFVPAGEIPHSRNIPDDKREDFAKAVEAKAEITFAG